MIRKILFGTALATMAVAPAFAQTASPWTGFYVGVNGGYGGDKFTYPITGSATIGASTLTLDSRVTQHSSGFLGGGQVGYNHLTGGNWLLGAEADIAASDISGEVDASGALSGLATGSASLRAGSKLTYLGTARARVGYAMDRFVPYVTGGLAYGSVKSMYDIDVSSGSATLLAASNSTSKTRAGWTVGAGAEYAINDRLSFKTEYLYADLGKRTLISGPFNVLGIAGSGTIGVNTKANVVRAGLNYRFGG